MFYMCIKRKHDNQNHSKNLKIGQIAEKPSAACMS